MIFNSYTLLILYVIILKTLKGQKLFWKRKDFIILLLALNQVLIDSFFFIKNLIF